MLHARDVNGLGLDRVIRIGAYTPLSRYEYQAFPFESEIL